MYLSRLFPSKVKRQKNAGAGGLRGWGDTGEHKTIQKGGALSFCVVDRPWADTICCGAVERHESTLNGLAPLDGSGSVPVELPASPTPAVH